MFQLRYNMFIDTLTRRPTGIGALGGKTQNGGWALFNWKPPPSPAK